MSGRMVLRHQSALVPGISNPTPHPGRALLLLLLPYPPFPPWRVAGLVLRLIRMSALILPTPCRACMCAACLLAMDRCGSRVALAVGVCCSALFEMIRGLKIRPMRTVGQTVGSE